MRKKLKDALKIFHMRSEQMEEELKVKKQFTDLTSKQLECLEIIMKLHNPSPSELAEQLGITKPSISAMIDKLSSKNYVRKVQSDEDRRSAHVHLTEKGKAASLLHEDIHSNLARKMEKTLTEDEKSQLAILLNKAIKDL